MANCTLTSSMGWLTTVDLWTEKPRFDNHNMLSFNHISIWIKITMVRIVSRHRLGQHIESVIELI